MKRLFRVIAALSLAAAAPTLWAADARQDYREQWPLQLSAPQAGAYRLMLGEAQYRSAVSPQLADVQVFNAQGQPLPSALFSADQPLAQAAQWQDLAWFPLPAQGGGAGDDLQLLTERNTDGSVRRVEARLGRSVGNAGPGGWLVDASALRTGVQALRLDWQASQALQVRVRVDASDDLRDWQRVADDVPLVDLQHDGRRLQQRRIEIGRQAKYFRIVPVGGDALPTLSAVQAEKVPLAQAIDWQWRSLAGSAGKPGEFEYTLDGRFPIAQADIATADNSVVQWTLLSRDDANQPWQVRAGPWVAYQLQDTEQRRQSQAQALAVPIRDRFWKLTASQAQVATAPTLKLGYQPEALVFLSQGEAPFSVAAGSVRAARSDAPVGTVIAQLREQQGAQWQPALATVQGAAQPLAGDAALQPVRDWKRWLLWGLLVLGVGVVGGFAVSLLRQGDRSNG
ncbi:DUF3999 domain-containing protein [Stenotrophomonas sp. PD6]|uniref:DUF3999 domain-containing protein n=1 Tax=Stenotrophomonas sp. PD6 TaxID=3368612 RepID=UPI003BA3BBF1